MTISSNMNTRSLQDTPCAANTVIIVCFKQRGPRFHLLVVYISGMVIVKQLIFEGRSLTPAFNFGVLMLLLTFDVSVIAEILHCQENFLDLISKK